MIERYLYAALQSGLAEIKSNNSILEDLFSDLYELIPTEVAGIKTWFNAQTPKVIHNYSRMDQEMPIYSIVLDSESEDESVIGDSAGIIEDPDDPNFGADCDTAIWKHQYSIMCISEHPDVTLYMYEIAKSILLAALPQLVDVGLFEGSLSGQDLAPDPRYVPEHLFVRRLGFGCNSEFLQTNKLSKLSKAFKVGGIHIDKNGSPSDVGDVKTNIGLYTVGDTDGEI